MENLNLLNLIRSWNLEDVEMGSDIFGECIIDNLENYNIEEGKMFNNKMENELINIMFLYKNNILEENLVVDNLIKIINNVENYN
jgi:hypothetical protein